MKNRYYLLKTSISIFFLISLVSLTNPVLPPVPYDYESLNLPSHMSAFDVTSQDNTPSNNPISDDGATLGRVLFYDKNLSRNNTVSCGSCHQQEHAFSDTSSMSVGFHGDFTRRNSMSLVNSRWFSGGQMFWDTRGNTLEQAVLMPIQDTIEMGLTLLQLVQVVQQQPYYSQLFSNAFGDTAVTTLRIGQALAQFVRSIISYSSKYDIGRAQEFSPTNPFSNFTPGENEGKQIFFSTSDFGGGDCFVCHRTDAFTGGPLLTNNGLDAISTIDSGAFEVTGSLGDIGKFKTPTLRNIALTAPYMHDGRFNSLFQVIDFYSTNIQLHRNLTAGLIVADSITGALSPKRFDFTPSQIMALVDFLNTLSDYSILTEVKWSDPFIIPTSVPDVNELQLAIYPNPCANYFSVYADGILQDRIVDLEITDVKGKTLFSQKVFLTEKKLISISDFPDGVYFVIIKIDGKRVTKKLVKGF